MRFIAFLWQHNKLLVILAGVIGTASGAANAKLISLITQSLVPRESDEISLGLYMTFAGAAIVFSVLSQLILIYLSQKLTQNLRLNMSQQILDLSQSQIERAGGSRLMATFTQDIPAITEALMMIPALFINAAIISGCMVYLGYLSLPTFGILVVFLLLGLVTYILPERVAVRFMDRTREAWDDMLTYFETLEKGSKELKLHYRRRSDFYNDYVYRTTENVRQFGYTHRVIYALLSNWSYFLYFTFIGLLLYVIPRYQPVGLEVLTGFSIIVLYLRAPITILMTTIPVYRRANIAFAKIKEAGMSLIGEHRDNPYAGNEALLETIDRQPPMDVIRLEGVTYAFRNEDHPFTLGPLDLTIRQGELVFLIGGNGSGKTTFGKLITGLYTPTDGQIFINGDAVTEENRDIYRQHFSAIFSDFYVFEQIMGLDREHLDARAHQYLEKLDLRHKVKVVDGMLSTTRLSAGQRKRLALLTVYLEERPIYLFDEWAADQDPEFKEVFYRHLLPELKEKGKTVLVISHDDRYFDVADRVIELREGMVAAEEYLPTRTLG